MNFGLVSLFYTAAVLVPLCWTWTMHYIYFDCVHGCNCYDEFYKYQHWDSSQNGSSADLDAAANDTDYSYSYHILEWNHTDPLSMIHEGTFIDCRSLDLGEVHQDWTSNVTVMKLAHNGITHLPGKIFSKYRQLYTLTLDYNSISRVHADAFAHLDDLFYLSLSNNELTVLAPETFAKLTGLSYLVLDFNDLTRVPFVRPMSHLACLTVSSNQLEELDGSVFSDDVELHTLDIRHNRFKKAPLSLAKFLNAGHTMEPFGYVYMSGNPWVCDCGVSLLKEFWPRHPRYLQDAINCAFPESLKGENIWQVPDSSFVCDNTTDFGEINIDDGEVLERGNPAVYSSIELAGACVGCLFLGVLLCGAFNLGVALWKRYRSKKDSETSAFVKMEETG